MGQAACSLCRTGWTSPDYDKNCKNVVSHKVIVAYHQLAIPCNPHDATCALFIRDSSILLGLRAYDDARGDLWTTPGGLNDRSQKIETRGDCLRRETREETGITEFEVTEFMGTVPARGGGQLYVFVCRSDQEPQLMEPEKFRDWRWMEIDDIPDNFINKDLLELLKQIFGAMQKEAKNSVGQ